MTTITELHETVQTLLTSKADELGRRSGLIRRQRQLSGAGFAQTLVLGGLLEPNATRSQQQQHAILAGMTMSAQGLEQRIEQVESRVFMEALLQETLNQLLNSETVRKVFPAFNGVYLTDCTRLAWPGLPLKAGVRLNLQNGQLEVALMGLLDNDQKTVVIERTVPKGALQIADLGFFKLARFKGWSDQGVFWLTRYKVGTRLATLNGRPLVLADCLSTASDVFECAVRVGCDGLTARLIAQRLPSEALAKRMARLIEQARLDQKPIPQRQLELSGWTIYLTNVPDLTFDHAFILARARWQIELLFKLWKSHAKLLTSRSSLPIRHQVEGLAKFIGVILAHWCLLVTGWQHDALSPLDAFNLLRSQLPILWRALSDPQRFGEALATLKVDLAHLSPSSKRKNDPLAFQLWADFDYAFP